MHRLLLQAAASALLIAGLAACEEQGGQAGEANAGNQFVSAADALQAKLGGAQVPPANDPAVQAFEQQSAAALDALGTDRMPLDGFTSFERYCGKSAQIIAAYVGAGVGEEGQEAQMVANVERYIDQMFTPMLFAAHCSAAHMPFLEGELSPEEAREKAAAVNQIRTGAFSQVTGLMQLSVAPDLDAARRARVLDLLAQDAAKFALALTPQQRQQLAGMAQELRAQLPADSAPKADTIRAAFEKQECGTLCSM